MLIIIIIGGFAAAMFFGVPNLGITPTTPIIPTGPTQPTPPAATIPPSGVITSAKAQWLIRDILTKTVTAAGDTAYVGIVKADASGYFNLLTPMEETEFDAAPDTSAITYSTGDELLLAVSSDNDPTGGSETYPRWFYIASLNAGAPIKALPLTNPISALTESVSGSNYKYKVSGATCETVGTVQLLSGTTPYWDFGYFELYGRAAKDYLIEQITNKGVVGCTVNDGATWVDTNAEISANFTFTSDQEDLYFELVGEAANVAYGLPTLAVTASGQVKQYNAVLVWTTDATGIDPQPLIDDGWKQLDKVGLTGDVAFYYVIDPVRDGCIPASGGIISLKVPLTVSDSGLTASTEYEFEGWVLDWQNAVNVAGGITTTSLPSYNGFISEVGCDTIVQPLALTVSSGSAATMQLLGHFTTNA